MNMLKMYEAYKYNNLYRFWGPRTAEIEIINTCNLRCKMCHRWKWRNKGNKLDFKTIKRIIREVREIGGQNILISGGEPLMRSDFVGIVKEVHSNGMGVILFTNGTVMNEGTAEELAKGGARFVFSIDSSKPEIYEGIRGVKGSWENAIRGVRAAVRMNKKHGGKATVGINYTVQRDNVGDMFDTAKLAEKEGLDYIRFGLVHGQEQVGLGEEELPILKSQVRRLRGLKQNINLKILGSQYFSPILDGEISLKDVQKGIPAFKLFERDPVPCFVCSQFTLIDGFGDVYSCTYGYLDNDLDDKGTKELRKKNCLGNVFEKSLKDIWCGERYMKFRREHSPVDISKFGRICGQCEHYFALKAIRDYFRKLDRAKGNLKKGINDHAWCGCDNFETSI